MGSGCPSTAEPRVLASCHRQLRGSPDHVSALSSPGTRPGIRPVISWRGRSSCRGFLSPFGRRDWLFGHPVPAKELGLPRGRLTRPDGAGPRRGFRVSHARAAIGVGALSTPGTTVLTLTGVAHRPAFAVSQRLSPCTPPQPSIHAGLRLTKHQPRVQTISPVRSSPRLWLPDETGTLGLEPRASHPALTSHARRGGDRSSSTDLNQRSTSPSTQSLQSCVDPSMRATSRRTRRSGTLARVPRRSAWTRPMRRSKARPRVRRTRSKIPRPQ